MSLQKFYDDSNSKNQHLVEDQVVSPGTAARLLNISPVTLWRMWRRGEGPPKLRISPHRCGVRLKDIREFLDRAAV
jgi:predicted DNA-binding transcriptional regulator AlpA